MKLEGTREEAAGFAKKLGAPRTAEAILVGWNCYREILSVAQSELPPATIVNVAKRHHEWAYQCLFYVTPLTATQRDLLVKGAAKEAWWAYECLRFVTPLTATQRDLLVKGVAKEAWWAYECLLYANHLTEEQKVLLRGACAAAA